MDSEKLMQSRASAQADALPQPAGDLKISELNQEMLNNLQGGNEVDKSNDWTVLEIEGKRYLTTGISLYELLDDEKYSALCLISEKDPSLLLYPYKDTQTGTVIEPGKECLGGSVPYITEIMAKIAAGRPWSKPDQSSSKTFRQHRAVKRAQFDLKAGADETKVLQMLEKDFAQIDHDENSDEDQEDTAVTWADIRRKTEAREKKKTSQKRRRLDASGTESDQGESDSEMTSSASAQSSDFDNQKTKKNRNQTFEQATADNGEQNQSGFDGTSPFLNQDDNFTEENENIGRNIPSAALSNLPRYQAGQFSGYGKINSAPSGAPVININCSGKEPQEANESDEEEQYYDPELEAQREVMEYNNRSLMADADMIEEYNLDPVLAQKPHMIQTLPGGGTKQRENDVLGWHVESENPIVADQEFQAREYDEYGGYYDEYGCYWDANGGYIDTEGGYFDRDGGYTSADGQIFTPAQVQAWDNDEEAAETKQEEAHFFNGEWLPILKPANVMVNEKGQIEKRLDKNLTGLSSKEARKVQKERQEHPDEITKTKSTINQIEQQIDGNSSGKKKTLADDLKGFNLPPDMLASLAKQGALDNPISDFPNDLSQIQHLGKQFVPSKSREIQETTVEKQPKLQSLSNETKASPTITTSGAVAPSAVAPSANFSATFGATSNGKDTQDEFNAIVAAQMRATAAQLRASADQMDAAAQMTVLFNKIISAKR